MACILIADDDPVVRELAVELLHASDHAVVGAENGLEALRLIAAVPVDVLVIDMLMPVMDGVETILMVRHRHPQVKIIAISSGGSIGARPLLGMARSLGAHVTLEKPLRSATLMAAIEGLVDAPESGRTAASRTAARLASQRH